jgi:hypothetical protein
MNPAAELDTTSADPTLGRMRVATAAAAAPVRAIERIPMISPRPFAERCYGAARQTERVL